VSGNKLLTSSGALGTRQSPQK